ncbi:MAG TPA: AMP-binding protein, partial [Solirubrobacterales bacterium]|nr:AMP-binding protein [Solirubrobacterales bacterium]
MNAAGLLTRAAVQHGGAEAVRFGERAVTYAELSGRALRLGRALTELGLEPGDRVALLQANGIEMVESMFGVWAAGMTIVPINSRTHAREAAYVVENCEARAVIYGGEYEDELLAALETSDSLRLISLEAGGRTLSYEDLLAANPPLTRVAERGPD